MDKIKLANLRNVLHDFRLSFAYQNNLFQVLFAQQQLNGTPNHLKGKAYVAYEGHFKDARKVIPEIEYHLNQGFPIVLQAHVQAVHHQDVLVQLWVRPLHNIVIHTKGKQIVFLVAKLIQDNVLEVEHYYHVVVATRPPINNHLQLVNWQLFVV